MKALILNSGLGHRMGVLTSEHPKCMTEISHKNTILSRQLRQIADAGIKEVLCLDIDGVIVAVALVNSAWGGRFANGKQPSAHGDASDY